MLASRSFALDYLLSVSTMTFTFSFPFVNSSKMKCYMRIQLKTAFYELFVPKYGENDTETILDWSTPSCCENLPNKGKWLI